MSQKPNNIPPAYIASNYEDAIYALWEESGAFRPDYKKDSPLPRGDVNTNKSLSCQGEGAPLRGAGEVSRATEGSGSGATTKPPFVITMPPPNATGQLHLGHSVMLALEDIMIRFHRMKGHPTVWIPGTDHAGIATQNKVERDTLEKEGKTRHDYGREKFVQKIKAFVADSQNTIRNQTRKMGASCDWSREYYSLDESLNKTVNFTFKKMFEDGLIYRGDRIVNWCTRCASTISDDEVDYKEQTTNFYYFQYGPFEIGTARPETKYGDHIVVVHPDDERYKKYHGQKLSINWIGQTPITATVVADELSDMSMGSGVMTATPAHSFVDFELAKKYGFEVTQMIDEEGKLTSANGPYEGLTTKEARKTFVAELQQKGLVNRIDESYVNNLSVCSRCKTPIEPLVSKQWFIDVNHPVSSWEYESLNLETGRAYSLKEVMQHVVRDSQIEIMPEREKNKYFQWIDNLRDWCISRQLWWGHQIPVYYKGEEVVVSEESPGPSWNRDPDTLDTWFSAGLFTFSPLKWIDGHDDFKKFHPTSVLETGYDILFFWVARMILMTTYVTGQIPFKTVYLHGLVRTRDGAKMSKSHPETCIDPLDIIPKYGADALRLSLFVGSTAGNDFRLYDEKIAGYRNFVNKLWNVSRYILMSTQNEETRKQGNEKTESNSPLTPVLRSWSGQAGGSEGGRGDVAQEKPVKRRRAGQPTGEKPGQSCAMEGSDGFHGKCLVDATYRPTPTSLADKWIVTRLNDLIMSTTRNLEAMNFSQAAEDLYHFTWNELADWYIEITKCQNQNQEGMDEGRMNQITNTSNENETGKILLYVLRKLLILWHPFTPYVTEEIWSHLGQPELLITAEWPSANMDLMNPQAVRDFTLVQQIITEIRALRQEHGVPPSKKISATFTSKIRADLVTANAEIIKFLARVDQLSVNVEKPKDAVSKFIGDLEIHLPLSGLIDPEHERARLEKEVQKLSAYVENLKKKLANNAYVKNAPKDVITQDKAKLKETEAGLKKFKIRLKSL